MATGPSPTKETQPQQGNVKGTVLVQVVKALRAYPDGRDAVPPGLRDYVEKRILAANWYPEEDYIALLGVLAPFVEHDRRITDWPRGVSYMEYIGRSAVATYAQGPYKALFRGDDVVRALRNFRSFWELRHDTGTARVLVGKDQRSAVLELEGCAVRSKDYCEMLRGSIWGFLSHGGADPERIEVRKDACTAEGDPLCRWKLSW